jgi:hypothetical protein
MCDIKEAWKTPSKFLQEPHAERYSERHSERHSDPRHSERLNTTLLSEPTQNSLHLTVYDFLSHINECAECRQRLLHVQDTRHDTLKVEMNDILEQMKSLNRRSDFETITEPFRNLNQRINNLQQKIHRKKEQGWNWSFIFAVVIIVLLSIDILYSIRK